jgi:hypothetical protein
VPEDKNWETPLVAIDEWQIRSLSWQCMDQPVVERWGQCKRQQLKRSRCQPDSNGASGTTPDAVRLEINLSPTQSRQAQHGRITLDWMRPNFSNNKT